MHRVGHDVDYSTWNPRTLNWDYWRAMGDTGLRAGVIAKPPRLSTRKLGLAPEEATRRLPAGAKRIGSGDVARGQVAGTGLGAVGSGIHPLWLLGGAYLVYRYVWKG
jgi:hypothetical protein